MCKEIDKIFGYIGIIIISLLGVLALTGLLLKSEIFVIPTIILFGIFLLFVSIYAVYIGFYITRKK
jgi:hypothetical protein